MSRIQTTHCGRLGHKDELVAYWVAQQGMQPDSPEYHELLESTVADSVRYQRDCGIDIVGDGEHGRLFWGSYLGQRLTGFEVVDDEPLSLFAAQDQLNHAEFYGDFWTTSWMMKRFSAGVQLSGTPVCTGPVTYTGQAAIAEEIANVKAGMKAAGVEQGFLNSTSPASTAYMQKNRYYDSDEAYLFAIADALHEEYKAITDSGLKVQIDDPCLVDHWANSVPNIDVAGYHEWAELRVAAVNRAVQGLPREQIRLHVCFGSWHGPHETDLAMKDAIPMLLGLNVGGFAVEASNARHEHEFTAWQGVDLGGRKVYPGIVGHATDTVESPELVAWRIGLWADAVGPENLVASTDCGLGDRVYPTIEKAKLTTLAAGAQIASKRIFG